MFNLITSQQNLQNVILKTTITTFCWNNSNIIRYLRESVSLKSMKEQPNIARTFKNFEYLI